MAIVAVSIAPSGTESSSLSRYVARALEVIRDDGRVEWELNSMFTTMQGELADCLEIIGEMHEALAEMGAPRIASVIKIDDRRDKPADMKVKVESALGKMSEEG